MPIGALQPCYRVIYSVSKENYSSIAACAAEKTSTLTMFISLFVSSVIGRAEPKSFLFLNFLCLISFVLIVSFDLFGVS